MAQPDADKVRLSDSLLDCDYIKSNYVDGETNQMTRDEVVGHYLQHVRAKYLNPNNTFSERIYRQKYPDVESAVGCGEFVSGYHHWVIIGQSEGRNSFLWKADDAFRDLWNNLDFVFISKEYGHLIGSCNDDAELFEFYLKNARELQLNPTTTFDEKYYQIRHPDVTKGLANSTFVSGFHHWVMVGRGERRASAIPLLNKLERAFAHQQMIANIPRENWLLHFDPEYYAKYLTQNFGVQVTQSTALDFFLREGVFRGDVPTLTFDEDFYISYNEDVANAKAEGRIPSGFVHFVIVGAEEGRPPIHNLATCLELKMGTLTEGIYLQNVDALEAKLSPPNVEIVDAPVRVNVFVPSLDPDIMFGGYISLLNFLSRAVEAGWRIVFLICEDGQSNRAWFLKGIAHKPRWLQAFSGCDFYNLSTTLSKVPVGRDDICLAYSAWTAYVASSVAKRLNSPQFIFYIQEYEAIFHENNSLSFIVEGAYDLDHVAVFNTTLLAQYFRSQKIGVFKCGRSGKYLSYQHALADNKPNPDYLNGKSERTLLFYGRPERHAGRNLFEIGVLALRRAVADGIIDSSWFVVGLGGLGGDIDVDLGGGCTLFLKSRLPQHEYEEILKSVDVGLSLMWAPHPSILPFELAKSGAVCVTNVYVNRSANLLAGFGFNIVPAEPSLEGIVCGLKEAVARSSDVEARVNGASFDWPVDWDVVFNKDFIADVFSLPSER